MLGLSFFVPVQPYELAAGVRIGFSGQLAVALVAGPVSVGLVPAVDDRLVPNGRA